MHTIRFESNTRIDGDMPMLPTGQRTPDPRPKEEIGVWNTEQIVLRLKNIAYANADVVERKEAGAVVACGRMLVVFNNASGTALWFYRLRGTFETELQQIQTGMEQADGENLLGSEDARYQLFMAIARNEELAGLQGRPGRDGQDGQDA